MPCDAQAQLAQKLWQVGFLTPTSLPETSSATPSMTLSVFTQRMKELGWVAGQTFT